MGGHCVEPGLWTHPVSLCQPPDCCHSQGYIHFSNVLNGGKFMANFKAVCVTMATVHVLVFMFILWAFSRNHEA
ncbi:unnamed protein product [Coregonus sp. 'balchen']|nr:unnamed protein product [Coregonus sp. 'balchen']